MDSICEEAGVTKGCFFHHFKSKEEMTKEVIERFTGDFLRALSSGCCPGMDQDQRVYAVIDGIIAMSKNPESKGCLVGALVQESWEMHPELRKICSQSLGRLIGSFKQNLEAVGDKRCPQKDIDRLALSFMATVQGALILIKATGDRSIMEKTLTTFKNHLRSVFGR